MCLRTCTFYILDHRFKVFALNIEILFFIVLCRTVYLALEYKLKILFYTCGFVSKNTDENQNYYLNFRLCTPLNGTIVNDVANLFENLIGLFEDVVQVSIMITE